MVRVDCGGQQPFDGWGSNPVEESDTQRTRIQTRNPHLQSAVFVFIAPLRTPTRDQRHFLGAACALFVMHVHVRLRKDKTQMWASCRDLA
jgi:hypothetical protein